MRADGRKWAIVGAPSDARSLDIMTPFARQTGVTSGARNKQLK